MGGPEDGEGSVMPCSLFSYRMGRGNEVMVRAKIICEGCLLIYIYGILIVNNMILDGMLL